MSECWTNAEMLVGMKDSVTVYFHCMKRKRERRKKKERKKERKEERKKERRKKERKKKERKKDKINMVLEQHVSKNI